MKSTKKYLKQTEAHKISCLEGKILIRAFKALKINYKRNNINHTVIGKDTTIFEPDIGLKTYKISYLTHTHKNLCGKNYPPHFTNRELSSEQFAVPNHTSNYIHLLCLCS